MQFKTRSFHQTMCIMWFWHVVCFGLLVTLHRSPEEKHLSGHFCVMKITFFSFTHVPYNEPVMIMLFWTDAYLLSILKEGSFSGFSPLQQCFWFGHIKGSCPCCSTCMVGLSPSICTLLRATVGVISNNDCSTGGNWPFQTECKQANFIHTAPFDRALMV